MRGLTCELNNTCYSLPQDASKTNRSIDQSLNQMTKLFTDTLQFANKPQVVTSLNTLASFAKKVMAIRDKAGTITGNLKLSQYLIHGVGSFENKLTIKQLFVNDSAMVTSLLNSHPNYNFLYSNYSTTFTEPNMLLSFALKAYTKNGQMIIDFLYGPDLDVNHYILSSSSNALKYFFAFF